MLIRDGPPNTAFYPYSMGLEKLANGLRLGWKIKLRKLRTLKLSSALGLYSKHKIITFNEN
jgi:hypothetical protein